MKGPGEGQGLSPDSSRQHPSLVALVLFGGFGVFPLPYEGGERLRLTGRHLVLSTFPVQAAWSWGTLNSGATLPLVNLVPLLHVSHRGAQGLYKGLEPPQEGVTSSARRGHWGSGYVAEGTWL